jgi:hypothetical protein
MSVLSACLLMATSFYYQGLGSDGGWYSYPALALSRGERVDDNLTALTGQDEISKDIKSKYGFKTYSSIRVLYTGLWFRFFPQNIYSVKIISLLEVFCLYITVYFLILKFCKDKIIALLLMAIFINDKAIVLSAASDFRPDIITAAISCLFLWTVFIQQLGKRIIAMFLVACILVLTHKTAILPFCCVIFYALINNILNGKINIRENYLYSILAILVVYIYLQRSILFNALFITDMDVFSSPVKAADRLAEIWKGGLGAIICKEFYRWRTYFFTTNVAQLAVFLAGGALFIYNSKGDFWSNRQAIALLLTIITGLALYAFIDPHRADVHVIPIVPFFFLFFSQIINLKAFEKRRAHHLLIGLICCLASISSIVLAGKIAVEGRNSGYNIRSLSSYFEKVFDDQDRDYLVVGPTEVWPFIPKGINITILDTTRSGHDFSSLDPFVDSVDYVLINKDYQFYNWEKRFLKHFPDYFLKKAFFIGNTESFIQIYKLENLVL